MSKQELVRESAEAPADGLEAIESSLGHVLALIHRVLPRLDESARAADVQASLRKAMGLLDSAREAHARYRMPGGTDGEHRVATGVDSEIAAVIAAAVSVLINRPYRLVSVQPIQTAAPALSVWALEGRTQIFQSHRIR